MTGFFISLIFSITSIKKEGIGLFLAHTLYIYKSIQRMSIGIINILNVYQLQSSPHLQVLIEVNPTASTVHASEWGRPSKGSHKVCVFFLCLIGCPWWEDLLGGIMVVLRMFQLVSLSVSPKGGHKSA